MGFSVSASTAVIFAGLFLSLGMFYPAVANSYERVQAADANQADRALDQANSDIQISTVSTTGGNSAVNVVNQGSTALPVNKTDIMINGEYQKRNTVSTDISGDATTELWLPSETLTLEPSQTLNSGDNIRVVTEHGVSASTVA
ncbi:MAG: putative archaeal flagellar protein F [Halonotius sp. J07HN4]|jgi:Putative archaeal flagellar protein F|nr:MAG: putative archaeal flagellar protein F [Halonotius sp. J07HN4]